MAAMTQPSPSLYAAVLQALRSTDPWSQPLSSVLSGLVAHLTTDEAESLPEAIAGVLPMLRQDRDRLRFAAEIAARLDYFETAGAICDLALGLGDRGLLLEAASLCGNPAVDSGVRARVSEAVGNDPAGRIRLDSSTVPVTAEEVHLYRQCWPGVGEQDDQHAVMPMVVLDSSFDAAALLRLAVRLDEAGSSVRRLVPAAEIAPWFGRWTVLVCGHPARSRVLSKYPRFSEYRIIVGALPLDDRGGVQLLTKINACLRGTHRLSLDSATSDVPIVWDPGVFLAGAYVTKEAAFLAGTTSSSLNYLRRRGLLTPRTSAGCYWTFRDVVAVRTWTYLKSISPRRVSSRVVTSLARFAGDSTAAQLGVTSSGDVLVNQGKGWVDVESGESPLEFDNIADFDDVFRPFSYGGRETLDLLRASENTRLDPTVLHGTPHLSGHRISAKALASVDRHGERRVIEAAYPELAGKPFEDTARVGVQLLSAV